MKAVILAGGRGTRISEESQSRPKPMVEIGGRPILWHIMKIYGAAGITDFVVLLGYRGYMIKEYFANYFLHMSDVTIDLANELARGPPDPVRALAGHPARHGAETMTGGRLPRARPYLGDETFCLTYGDGVADVDVRRRRRVAPGSRARSLTVTAVQPAGRYGALTFADGRDPVRREAARRRRVDQRRLLRRRAEHPRLHRRRRHGVRAGAARAISSRGELNAYQHSGFWHGMDTLWDKIYLDGLWEQGAAPWKVWGD